jgi:hypothetical protein
MTENDMKIQMEEDHPYRLAFGWWDTDKTIKSQRDSFTFGAFSPVNNNHHHNVPSLVNEYGWIWQTRDGTESAIRVNGNFLPYQETPYTDNYEYYEPGGEVLYKDRDIFEFFLGKKATAYERFQFQAYYLAAEAEALRASKSHGGILSLPYLTNNRGYTGDWWLDNIADLKPSQTLMMQYHISKLFAAYINHEDQRYNKNRGFYYPATTTRINLFATNESGETKSGKMTLKCIDAEGKAILLKELDVALKPFGYKSISVNVQIPDKEGGYMLLTELSDNAAKESDIKQVSRRYIRVGDIEKPVFYDYQYTMPSLR